jgi:telomerase Cajal body protein 1
VDSARSTLRSVILPPDLLTAPPPLSLKAFSQGSFPEPIRAIAGYPLYDLSNSPMTVALLSAPDQPIRLINTLYQDLQAVSTFPYIKPETEEYIPVCSLTFTPDGRHFIAGADSELGVFDAYLNGSGPIERFRYRKHGSHKAASKWDLGRGILSTLDISPNTSILAVGTFSRKVGLYSNNGRGECITVIDLQTDSSLTGRGVSQVKWTQCGTYLCVAERYSDEILIFDVRNQQKLVQRLANRNAKSFLRMNFDIREGILVAGGMDGIARVWNDVGKTEGTLFHDCQWKAHDGRF